MTDNAMKVFLTISAICLLYFWHRQYCELRWLARETERKVYYSVCVILCLFMEFVLVYMGVTVWIF